MMLSVRTSFIGKRRLRDHAARPAAAAINGNNRMMERNRRRLQSLYPVQADAETDVGATRRCCGAAGSLRWRAPAAGPRWRSDAQGHVTEQPLLRAAVVAVSEGGDHLVLLRRHVQTLVAVHVQQGEPLKSRRRESIMQP